MKCIEKTVCEVVMGGRKDKPHKVWKIIECPDIELIGLMTSCGVPNIDDYDLPVGSQYVCTINVPINVKNEVKDERR